MYRVLRDSRIAINRHIDAAEGYSNNMRLFEATGVGTLLMTEASHNLDSLFIPGDEVVAYEGVDDDRSSLHYREHEVTVRGSLPPVRLVRFPSTAMRG